MPLVYTISPKVARGPAERKPFTANERFVYRKTSAEAGVKRGPNPYPDCPGGLSARTVAQRAPPDPDVDPPRVRPRSAPGPRSTRGGCETNPPRVEGGPGPGEEVASEAKRTRQVVRKGDPAKPY